jgi:hypothetical protein
MYDCGREPFVRDGRVELLQIANRRTNGRNTFSDDVFLSNTDTKMLVNPISRKKNWSNLLFQSLMKKTLNVAAWINPKDQRGGGRERKGNWLRE